MQTTRPHLLLLGHGSHLDSNSSAPVHALAQRLEEHGEFGPSSVAFWKEEPSLSRALDAFPPGATVIAIPIFISNGYFVQEVVPRELGLIVQGPSGHPNTPSSSPADAPPLPQGRERGPWGEEALVRGVHVHYTPPIGDHPRLAEVIALRAKEAGAGARDAVAVLGHGTNRNRDSEGNVFAQAERVRAMGAFAEVTTVFMDQEPSMASVFERVAAERVFMVPLFIADGWHVGQTIPEELALDASEARRADRRLTYTPPVGTHPSLVQVVFDLANEAIQ